MGGNSQDIALYNPTTKSAVIPKSEGPFSILTEHRETQSSLSLNLGLSTTSSSDWNSLIATNPLACNALRGKLVAWEYGNEPDLYITTKPCFLNTR